MLVLNVNEMRFWLQKPELGRLPSVECGAVGVDIPTLMCFSKYLPLCKCADVGAGVDVGSSHQLLFFEYSQLNFAFNYEYYE